MDQTFLFLGMVFVAFLYSSVGHGGASGYLAVMALAGFLPSEMKPTALVLNIITSSVAAWMFWRAGYFSKRLFLPLASTSVPMAFLGGHWMAPLPIFHELVAISLVTAAISLVVRMMPSQKTEKEPPLLLLLVVGAGLGFFSGLIGIGGGIFLTPLLLLCCWCNPKTASSVSALFILVNSTAGLLGNLKSLSHLPHQIPWLLCAVPIAGWMGSSWGSGRASNRYIRQALALGLVIAAVKMMVTA